MGNQNIKMAEQEIAEHTYELNGEDYILKSSMRIGYNVPWQNREVYYGTIGKISRDPVGVIIYMAPISPSINFFIRPHQIVEIFS